MNITTVVLALCAGLALGLVARLCWSRRQRGHSCRGRPVGPVVGPFRLIPRGALGRRLYRCRCGSEVWWDEYKRRRMWRGGHR